MDFEPIDDNAIPKSLQERLDEYNKKFEALNGLLGDNSLLESGAHKELRVEETKEVLAQALPTAVETMIGLCAFAVSETVRLKAAMFLIATSLGKDPAIKAEDPAKDLIERLSRPASGSESEDS